MNSKKNKRNNDVEEYGDEKMERKLPYYIGAFVFLFLILVDFKPWTLLKMTGEELYDIFARSLLLIIGIFSMDLGHESATRFRKRSKTIGALIGFTVGALAILLTLDIISISALGW